MDCWDRLDDDPDNLEFVLDDIKGPTRFADNTFDLVHLRQMRLTVRFVCNLRNCILSDNSGR